MDVLKFGAFIAEVRKEKNMTQAELAKEINVTDKAVSRWERGIGFPDIKIIESLAEALDLSVMELIQSEKSSRPEISKEEASKAITDIFELYKYKSESERNVLLSAALGITILLLAICFVGRTPTISFFCFVGSVLAIVGGWCYWQKNREDSKRWKIYLTILFPSMVVLVFSAFSTFPDFVLHRYAYLFLLILYFIMAVGSTRWIILFIRQKDKMRKGRFLYLILADIIIILISIYSIKYFAGRIVSSENIERENVVSQYAESLLIQDKEIQKEWIDNVSTTYIQPEKKGDERTDYMVIFTCRKPEDDKVSVYEYKIGINYDYTLEVLEKSES